MTGVEGQQNNRRMAAAIAEGLGVPLDSVLTCSTGVIGVQLPVQKIVAVAPHLIEALEPDPMATAESHDRHRDETSSREIFLAGACPRSRRCEAGSG